MNDSDARRETLAVAHGERGQASASGVEDVVVPTHPSSAYSVPNIDPDVDLKTLDPDTGGYLYPQLSNPTRNMLKHQLAALKGADHVLTFVPGTAAIAMTTTAVVRPGDHIVAFEGLHDGTKTMLIRLFVDWLSVDVLFVDVADPENVAATMREEVALVWMGMPTNPLMHLCNIEAIAVIVDEGDTVFNVDNTFLSSQFQTPPLLGADVVVRSTTRYLNGHPDSIGGATATDREDVLKEFTFLQRVGMGSMLSPSDSYLTFQDIKTPPLRMRQHETNAMEIAEFLDSHETVTRVLHPGLESHPQHDFAACQQSGFGDMLSFELDTDLDGIAEFLGALREFSLAASLGGVESLTKHPATMTHSLLSQTERNALGISDSLLRLPVGVEHVNDLHSDLASALLVF